MTAELLQRRRDVTKADLAMKLEIEDWHGVADAAMDLREIDAMLSVLLKAEDTPLLKGQRHIHDFKYNAAYDDYQCVGCAAFKNEIDQLAKAHA